MQDGNTITITITEQDHRRLCDVATHYAKRESVAAISLLEELERACVVDAAEVGSSIVTMNSRITCHIDGGKERVVSLVYPHQADAVSGRISVLAPLGRALLGAAVGDEVRVVVGGRSTNYVVKAIEYQPEAAGDFHL